MNLTKTGFVPEKRTYAQNLRSRGSRTFRQHGWQHLPVLGKHNRNAPVCGLPEGTCSAGFPQSVAKTDAKNESIKVDCTKTSRIHNSASQLFSQKENKTKEKLRRNKHGKNTILQLLLAIQKMGYLRIEHLQLLITRSTSMTYFKIISMWIISILLYIYTYTSLIFLMP